MKIIKISSIVILLAAVAHFPLWESDYNENKCKSRFLLNAGGISLIKELSGEPVNEKKDMALSNYISLKNLYIKWDEGLFGSGKYYKRKVKEYLISIIGEEIITEYNYTIISPETSFEKKPGCKLLSGKWLEIKGDINDKDLKIIDGYDPESVEKWWRSRKLLSVRGKIKNFKLSNGRWGKVVTLYLEDIRLEQIDNTEKNSR